jgi:uncharacterized protein (DUF1778 family)
MQDKNTTEIDSKAEKSRQRSEIRFADTSHHELLRKAANLRKLSLNSWLIDVTLKAAKEELGIR